jgi:hypothetical protein
MGRSFLNIWIVLAVFIGGYLTAAVVIDDTADTWKTRATTAEDLLGLYVAHTQRVNDLPAGMGPCETLSWAETIDWTRKPSMLDIYEAWGRPYVLRTDDDLK